jgi:hypothetical protein
MNKPFKTSYSGLNGTKQFDLVVSAQHNPYKFIAVPTVAKFESPILSFNFEDRADGNLVIRKFLNSPIRSPKEFLVSRSKIIHAPYRGRVFVTDVFGPSGDPLFFKHSLPSTAEDISIFTLTDGEESATSSNRFLVNDSILYHNFRNEFDFSTEKYIVYLVRYKVGGYDNIEVLKRDLVYEEGAYSYQYYADDDKIYLSEYDSNGIVINVRYNISETSLWAVCQSFEDTYELSGSLDPALFSEWAVSLNSFSDHL